MLSNDEIKTIIESHLPTTHIVVNGDGYKYQAIIVSDEFIGKNLVQRQQRVYQAINQYINDGTIHAFSMRTYTPTEWEQQHNG